MNFFIFCGIEKRFFLLLISEAEKLRSLNWSRFFINTKRFLFYFIFLFSRLKEMKNLWNSRNDLVPLNFKSMLFINCDNVRREVRHSIVFRKDMQIKSYLWSPLIYSGRNPASPLCERECKREWATRQRQQQWYERIYKYIQF